MGTTPRPARKRKRYRSAPQEPLPATFAQVELAPDELQEQPGRRAALLGTLSVLLPLGPVLGVPAIVYGRRGRSLADRGLASNRSQATTGLRLGVLGTALWLVVGSVVVGLPESPEPSREAGSSSYEPYESFPEEPQPIQTHTVVYEVESTQEAWWLDHYSDGEGTFLSERGVELPWRKEVQMVGTAEDVLYGVSAGLEFPGEVTCRIFEDGKLVDTESDSGPDAYVSCTAGPPWVE